MAGIDPVATRRNLAALLADYGDTVQSDRRHLLDHFTLTDVAHKVVGVGSVGLRAWILLLEAGVASEGLLLQAKQAVPSVVAQVGGHHHDHQGARVVAGQRLMQASSDIFLGWLSTTVEGARQDYERDHAALEAAIASASIRRRSWMRGVRAPRQVGFGVAPGG